MGLGPRPGSSRCWSPRSSGLAGFVAIERRSAAPIVDFNFFRSRSFVGANIVAFAVSFAMFAVLFFLALYMQNILGYSPLETGVRFLPSTLVIMVAGPIAGRLADRIGPRTPLVFGLLLVTVSHGLAVADRGRHDVRFLVIPFILLGLGMGFTMSPMSTAAMNAVDRTKAGVASGTLSMTRMVGGTFGVAALGALVAHETDGAGAAAKQQFVDALEHRAHDRGRRHPARRARRLAAGRPRPPAPRGARHGGGRGCHGLAPCTSSPTSSRADRAACASATSSSGSTSRARRTREVEQLGEALDLHPVALEDTREFGQRPKLDPYGHHLLLVFYTARPTAIRRGRPSRWRSTSTSPAASWSRSGATSARPSTTCTPSSPSAGPQDEEVLVYRVLDALTDAFYPVIEAIEESVDALEAEVLDPSAARAPDAAATGSSSASTSSTGSSPPSATSSRARARRSSGSRASSRRAAVPARHRRPPVPGHGRVPAPDRRPDRRSRRRTSTRTRTGSTGSPRGSRSAARCSSSTRS